MKVWLNIISRIVLLILLYLLIVLCTRMHVFLAVPVMVIGFAVFVVLNAFLEDMI